MTSTSAPAQAAVCSVEDCAKSVASRGMCSAHYTYMRRHGEIEPLPALSPAERLAAGLVRQPNGCLEWTRSTTRDGYGQIRVDHKTVKTTRLAWELANGPIPDGLHVLHHCDNPPCNDIEHLFLGTQADNNKDMYSKGRNVSAESAVTHCPQGHEYTEANTRIYRGSRYCRECNRINVARWRAERAS